MPGRISTALLCAALAAVTFDFGMHVSRGRAVPLQPAYAANRTARADSARPAIETSGCGVRSASGGTRPGCFDSIGSAPGAIPIAVATGGACDTSQWTGTIFVTAAIPLPTCFATKTASSITIPFAAVVGINAASSDDPTHLQFAQHLIQSVSAMDNNHQEDALTVNFVSRTGGGGLPTNGWSEKVGLYVPTLMMPGANNTWAMNPDLVIQSGVGNYSAFLDEHDITNFNGDYAVGGCPTLNGALKCPAGQINANAANTFHTYLGSPITAGDWHTSSGTPAGTFSADVKAGQNTITTTGAAPYHGDLLTGTGIPPYTYVNDTHTSNGRTTVTMSNAATATSSGVPVTQLSYNMHIGLFFQGGALVRDNTINDSTNSKTSYMLYGTHDRAIDTSLATLAYAFVANSGQRFCFNSLSGCIYGDTSPLSVKLTSPIGILAVDSLTSGIGAEIDSANTKYPAMVHYTDSLNYNWGVGLDADGSFAFYNGRFPGNAGTKVGALSSAGVFQETLTTPASSSAACTAGQFTDDANYHYVCVAANKWKRVALFSF